MNQTLLNTIEEQFFAKAKAEFEKQKALNPEPTLLGGYTREKMYLGPAYTEMEKLSTEFNITVVDEPILVSLKKKYGDAIWGGENRHYSYYQSGNETTHDLGRLNSNQIWISELNEVMVTALDLIKKEKDYGHLYEQDPTKDRNIDVGYCKLFDKNGNEGVYVIWVERVKKQEGEESKFHIHCELIPRYYKSYRRYLVEGQE